MVDSARIGLNATRISLVASITSENARDSVNDFTAGARSTSHTTPLNALRDRWEIA